MKFGNQVSQKSKTIALSQCPTDKSLDSVIRLTEGTVNEVNKNNERFDAKDSVRT